MSFILDMLNAALPSVLVAAVGGIIWLYYSHRNHLKNFDDYKIKQDEVIADKLRIERLTTEKQALELTADYTHRFNELKFEALNINATVQNYIKRSVEVDEEQTESINKLRDLIINQLLNDAKEKARV